MEGTRSPELRLLPRENWMRVFPELALLDDVPCAVDDVSGVSGVMLMFIVAWLGDEKIVEGRDGEILQ